MSVFSIIADAKPTPEEAVLAAELAAAVRAVLVEAGVPPDLWLGFVDDEPEACGRVVALLDRCPAAKARLLALVG